ncbi:MAG TPA: DHA2 family efflux MFS transporter permease subunit [Ktedonobacterales bacterium]
MFRQNRGHKVGTLLVTCIGFFMVLLDASIVTVALPTIQSMLQARLSDLQWVVDAYTLPFAALLLTAGTLGDRFGRKRVFLAGLVIFTLGSALCGLAPSLGWLIAGRVVQGIGGAALSPGSLSVLAAAFPEPNERTQAIGIWSGISGIALAAGPLLGGLLIQVSGWQAIFFVNVPVGAVALVFGARVLSESKNPAARRLDLPGQALAVVGLGVLTYALIEGQTYGWGSPTIIGLFAAAAMLFVAFLVVEARSAEPLLPLDLFRNLVFSSANVAAAVVGFALLGTVFFVAQYFQEVQGFTALQSGERTLPNTMGIFLMAPLAGRLTARFGPRLPVTLGALLSGVALLLLTRLAPDTPYGAIWWNLGMLGTGFGLMLSPITAAVLATTPPTRAGLGSSVVNTSRQIGSVLGIAVLGAIVVPNEATNLTMSLTMAHLPMHTAATIANVIATAGANAGSLHLTQRLPLSAPSLHALIGGAFTDALHPAFITGGCALLAVAVLAMAFLRPQRARHVSPEAMAMPVSMPTRAATDGLSVGQTPSLTPDAMLPSVTD